MAKDEKERTSITLFFDENDPQCVLRLADGRTLYRVQVQNNSVATAKNLRVKIDDLIYLGAAIDAQAVFTSYLVGARLLKRHERGALSSPFDLLGLEQEYFDVVELIKDRTDRLDFRHAIRDNPPVSWMPTGNYRIRIGAYAEDCRPHHVECVIESGSDGALKFRLWDGSRPIKEQNS